ncbi:hypothetical protein ACTFIU_000048 [Dictyostelium citrinum]
MYALQLDWSQWKQCLAFPPQILLPSVNNLVFNDSKSSSSSSTSSVSSSSWYIPRSINQGVNRINSYSDSTTMEVGDYSTFQSHVKSIINTQKPGTTELYMSSWQPSTLKVYDSNYSSCIHGLLDLYVQVKASVSSKIFGVSLILIGCNTLEP